MCEADPAPERAAFDTLGFDVGGRSHVYIPASTVVAMPKTSCIRPLTSSSRRISLRVVCQPTKWATEPLRPRRGRAALQGIAASGEWRIAARAAPRPTGECVRVVRRLQSTRQRRVRRGLAEILRRRGRRGRPLGINCEMRILAPSPRSTPNNRRVLTRGRVNVARAAGPTTAIRGRVSSQRSSRRWLLRCHKQLAPR